MNQYFHLFSCCIPVKGAKKAVICDLQRNVIQPIPLLLYEILISEYDSETNTQEYIAEKYGEKDKQLIKEYITFLYHNQFGYTSEKPMTPIRMDLDTYEECRCITNAIVDFDQSSTHQLHDIIPQLCALHCFALEIRYFYPVGMDVLTSDLSATQHSTLKSLELLFEYSSDFVLENVLKLKAENPCIKKITVSNARENTVYNQEDLTLIYTTESIVDESCCGVISESYCIAETQLFLEAIHFNSCLNKKISVDKEGLVKNCPSMKYDFGHISTTKLEDVLRNDSFRRLWKINKDQIEVCSDCELRYVCQDCRAYIADTSNVYSKPIKCNYNPYE